MFPCSNSLFENIRVLTKSVKNGKMRILGIKNGDEELLSSLHKEA